jgi:hypothetical protein
VAVLGELSERGGRGGGGRMTLGTRLESMHTGPLTTPLHYCTTSTDEEVLDAAGRLLPRGIFMRVFGRGVDGASERTNHGGS